MIWTSSYRLLVVSPGKSTSYSSRNSLFRMCCADSHHSLTAQCPLMLCLSRHASLQGLRANPEAETGGYIAHGVWDDCGHLYHHPDRQGGSLSRRFILCHVTDPQHAAYDGTRTRGASHAGAVRECSCRRISWPSLNIFLPQFASFDTHSLCQFNLSPQAYRILFPVISIPCTLLGLLTRISYLTVPLLASE